MTGLLHGKSRRRAVPLLSGALCVLLLALTQGLSAGPAAAHGHDQFRIGKTVNGVNYCLDVAGDTGGGNGARVVLWTCHGGANQRWYRQASSNGYGTTIRSAWTGRCLDVEGAGGAGAKILLWDCHGGSNQDWTPQYIGGGSTYFNLKAGHANNLVLDVPGDQWYGGNRLQVYSFNWTNAQVFRTFAPAITA